MSAQPSSFSPHGSGGGGYMYSPTINPFNPENLFLVCDMAGVYHSKNSGDSWEIYPYDQIVSVVKGKIQFTSNPDTLYTISRSLTNQQDPLFRAVPVRSTDAGLSWQLINDPTETGVHSLFADPNQTTRIILNEYNRLFFSIDGGKDYKIIFEPTDQNCCLAGAFWDGDLIIVATNHGLLVSEDNGINFTLKETPGLDTEHAIFSMSGAKENKQIKLFVTTVSKSELFPWIDVIDLYHSFKDVYTITYSSGVNWQSTRANIPSDVVLRWIDLASNNTEIIYAAGDQNYLPVIYKSIDGGKNWYNTFKASNNENIYTGWGGDGGHFSYLWGGGALGFSVCKSNPDFVISTDGYSFMTNNGGNTWKQLHVSPEKENLPGQLTDKDRFYKSSGLNVTTGHTMVWLGKDTILMGCTDIGNQYSEDGGESWSFSRNIFKPWDAVDSPNWYNIVSTSDKKTLYAASSEINDIYLGYRLTDESIDGTSGLILKSIDKGISWQTLKMFNSPVVWVTVDPNNDQILFASIVNSLEGGIFRSKDGGITWHIMNLPVRTQGRPYVIRVLNDGAVVATFSARALQDQVTLTPSSGVFYSPDGGENWYDRTGTGMEYYTKDIIIDPNDTSENTWYTSVWGRFTTFEGPNNAGNGGIYRTKDRGLSWERIFKHERTESMAIHPQNPHFMYVAVELEGLFYTNNLNDSAGADFNKVSSFPFPRPKRMFFDPNDPAQIWVTTMGGGVWHGSDLTNSSFEISKPNEFKMVVFPNPSISNININIFSPTRLNGILSIKNVLGQTVFLDKIKILEGENQVKLTFPANISPGLYFVDLMSSHFSKCLSIILK